MFMCFLVFYHLFIILFCFSKCPGKKTTRRKAKSNKEIGRYGNAIAIPASLKLFVVFRRLAKNSAFSAFCILEWLRISHRLQKALTEAQNIRFLYETFLFI
ncbi:hypothetical protein Tcan_00814, partial [Toxocara canis]